MNEKCNMVYEDEKIISISGLIFYVLRKWRVLLIAMLLAGVAVGGISVMKSHGTQKNEPALETAEVAPMTASEEKTYQMKLAAIEEYEDIIENYENYMEKSIKVRLDPNGYYFGSVKYLFSSADKGEVLKALNICREAVNADEAYEDMAAQLEDHPEPAFLKEIIEYTEQSYSEDVSINMTGTNDKYITFIISVMHYDKEECEKLLSIFENYVDEGAQSLQENGIQARVELLSSFVQSSSDAELISYSQDIQKSIMTSYTAITDIEKNMTDAEQQRYELDSAEEEEDALEDSAVPSGISWTYVLAAVIGAAVLVAGIFGVLYIFDGRVRREEELESFLAAPIISLTAKEGRNNKGNIDKLLDSLESRMCGFARNNVEMVAAMLRNCAAQQEVERIYLSGSKMLKNDAKEMQQLKALLAQAGIELEIGDSILENSKALEKAADCGCVVFWEKREESLDRDVRMEVRHVLSGGVKILGIILER